MADPVNDPRHGQQLGRRLLMLRVAGVAAATGVAGAVRAAVPVPPAAAGAVAGRGVQPVITDNDPNDAAGYGRGRYYGPVRRSVTDNDPSDGPGRGRGYYAPPRRSVTDNDPNDGPGRGRGWR